ncbi:MAG TPA: tetratricopeptide repeat protein [Thermoanaerobaculia bacterium]|nr:tetratricopeptide repeat protein [Thermoanaerobaculia bacterium]
MLKRPFLSSSLLAAALLLPLGCGHSGGTAHPAAQENFGVQMARQNLWREALFRFRRAVELDPQDAMAHNNLAVAYEANGDFDNAAKEYREALRLDKGNTYIQKNYSRYVEFLSRNKKRQKGTATASAAAPAAAKTPAPAPAAAPPSMMPPMPGADQAQPPQPSQPQPPGGKP